MSDSEASPASDGGIQSESEHSQQESDPEVNNDTDVEDSDEERTEEATAEPSVGKVKKPRLLWVTLKEWNLREQERDDFMLEVQELAKTELVPFLPAGFLKSDPPISLAHWRQKSSVSEKKNNVLTTNYACPLAYRCACPVKLRLHEGPNAIALQLSGKHTPESHVQDRSKFLTAKMKGVIASKVKENPLKLATDIRR